MRRLARKNALVFGVLLLVSLAPSPSLAQSSDPRWEKPTSEDYVLTVGGVVSAWSLRFTNANLSEPRWSLMVPFEESVRTALRGSSRETIETMRTASDVLLYSLLLAPFVVDMPIGVGRHGSRGFELGVIALHTEAFAMLITEASKYLFSRARPYSYTCAGDEPDWRCGSKSLDESMISGHSAGAFSGAGLMCSFHVRGELAGNTAVDYSLCLASLALASTTAVLRIATDDHHVVDVVLGSLVGLVVGYGLPIWLYGMGEEPETDAVGGASSPLLFNIGGQF